jgi:hypothetical protein
MKAFSGLEEADSAGGTYRRVGDKIQESRHLIGDAIKAQHCPVEVQAQVSAHGLHRRGKPPGRAKAVTTRTKHKAGQDLLLFPVIAMIELDVPLYHTQQLRGSGAPQILLPASENHFERLQFWSWRSRCSEDNSARTGR